LNFKKCLGVILFLFAGGPCARSKNQRKRKINKMPIDTPYLIKCRKEREKGRTSRKLKENEKVKGTISPIFPEEQSGGDIPHHNNELLRSCSEIEKDGFGEHGRRG